MIGYRAQDQDFEFILGQEFVCRRRRRAAGEGFDGGVVDPGWFIVSAITESIRLSMPLSLCQAHNFPSLASSPSLERGRPTGLSN